MRTFVRSCLILIAAAALSLFAAAQDDSPSLGDVARQARQQKLKAASSEESSNTPGNPSKDAASGSPGRDVHTNTPLPNITQSKDQSRAKEAALAGNKGSKRVITNEDIPEHIGPTSTRPAKPRLPETTEPEPEDADGNFADAQQVKSSIQSMKGYIANMQSQIASLEDSIHYADGNCVSNCAQWNEQQHRKEQEAESLKEQVREQQKRLDEMQEQARRQGFGSAVYDPE